MIEALYNLGFALCATIVLALGLTVHGAVIVLRATRRTTGSPWLGACFVAILLVVFFVCAFGLPAGSSDNDESSWPRLERGHIPTGIARGLLDNTIEELPVCGEKYVGKLETCKKTNEDSIGHTGHSLERIVVLALAFVVVAGFSYIAAVAALTAPVWAKPEPPDPLPVPVVLVAAPPDPLPTPDAPDAAPDVKVAKPVEPDALPALSDSSQQMAQLNNLSMLAAITFVVTIISVQLLFRPGAEMIAFAHMPAEIDTLPQLLGYNLLSNALKTYWATIFSLALASAHFGAVVSLKSSEAEGFDFGGIWNVVKMVVLVLAPSIADFVLQIGESLGAVAN